MNQLAQTMRNVSIKEHLTLIATALLAKRRPGSEVDWRRRQAYASLAHWARIKLTAWKYRLRKRPGKFVLNNWYGRHGNNIQQILIGILHAEFFRSEFDLSDSMLKAGRLCEFFSERTFRFGAEAKDNSFYCFASNFFWFNEFSFRKNSFYRIHAHPDMKPRLESLLPAAYIEKEIHRVATQHLQSILLVPKSYSRRTTTADNSLVIHLRSGDVQRLDNTYYSVNPLYYYRCIAAFHHNALIVTEPGPPHALLGEIQGLFQDCRVVSGSARDDFEILRQARLLASSGVGTFAVAAALLSTNLEKFYCSNLYMDEHLNPKMLSRNRIDVIEIDLPGYREKWARTADRLSLAYNYLPE